MSGLDLDKQTLFCCRWGTMVALVWAMNEQNAELRVRHQMFNRRATIDAVLARPKAVTTEVLIRVATDVDRENFVEWGGDVPA